MNGDDLDHEINYDVIEDEFNLDLLIKESKDSISSEQSTEETLINSHELSGDKSNEESTVTAITSTSTTIKTSRAKKFKTNDDTDEDAEEDIKIGSGRTRGRSKTTTTTTTTSRGGVTGIGRVHLVREQAKKLIELRKQKEIEEIIQDVTKLQTSPSTKRITRN